MHLTGEFFSIITGPPLDSIGVELGVANPEFSIAD